MASTKGASANNGGRPRPSTSLIPSSYAPMKKGLSSDSMNSSRNAIANNPKLLRMMSNDGPPSHAGSVSSSTSCSLIPSFALIKKGLSNASVSSSRSASTQSGSCSNLAGSRSNLAGSRSNLAGSHDGGVDGLQPKQTRLANMCPTVPGHVVPPKSQVSTPRQPQQQRIPATTVAQRPGRATTIHTNGSSSNGISNHSRPNFQSRLTTVPAPVHASPAKSQVSTPKQPHHRIPTAATTQRNALRTAAHNGVISNSRQNSVAKDDEDQRKVLQDIGRERECHLEEIASLIKKHEAEKQQLESNCSTNIDTLKESHKLEREEVRKSQAEELEKNARLHQKEILAKDAKVLQTEEHSRNLLLEFGREREWHSEEITTLIKSHSDAIKQLETNFFTRIETLKESHHLQVEEIRKNRQEEFDSVERLHRVEIEKLKKKHANNLSEHKKQIPENNLHKEIESLRVVLEIRNEEIKGLRRELLEYKTKTEELHYLYEQSRVQQAKIEDLEAQIDKTRTDKNKILEKFNVMETSMTQVVNENDRLHLNNEELSWKIATLQTGEQFSSSDTSDGDFRSSM